MSGRLRVLLSLAGVVAPLMVFLALGSGCTNDDPHSTPTPGPAQLQILVAYLPVEADPRALPRITVLDVITGERKAISEPGEWWDLAWSPDGRYLAATRGLSREGATLEVFDRQDGTVHSAAVGPMPILTWAPDSSRLAVVSDRIAVFDSQAKLLASTPAPPDPGNGDKGGEAYWSPNSRNVANSVLGQLLVLWEDGSVDDLSKLAPVPPPSSPSAPPDPSVSGEFLGWRDDRTLVMSAPAASEQPLTRGRLVLGPGTEQWNPAYLAETDILRANVKDQDVGTFRRTADRRAVTLSPMAERTGDATWTAIRFAGTNYRAEFPAPGRFRTMPPMGHDVVVIGGTAPVFSYSLPPVEPAVTPTPGPVASDKNFELRLEAPRTKWKAGEPIEVTATLRYIGDGPGTPYYGSSSGPIAFSVREIGGTRRMDGAWTADCAPHSIEKSAPLVVPYIKRGGYSAGDPNEQFYRSFLDDPVFRLPKGTWEVTASVEFFLPPGCAEGNPRVELRAMIQLVVE